ncbi:MAG: hypothetical protein ABR928_02170 [Terracidiphilus sp.]|jgi:hypothetical protein
MSFAAETASTVSRALGKYCQEVKPVGKWRWQCAMLNGTRLPVAVSLHEGFVSLACDAETTVDGLSMLERAISANALLHNGVKMVLDASSRILRLHSDIAFLEEPQLIARLHWVLDGFHQGVGALAALGADRTHSAEPAAAATSGHLDHFNEATRESSWQFTRRGSDEFAVEIESVSAPPALICIDKSGIAASVELVRCNRADGAVPDALTIFLLTVTREMRLIRATRQSGNQEVFGLQAGLPVLPAPEELDHALAALSVAHRACAREANVLLNDRAARCYLAARNPSINPRANQ